MDSAFSKRSSGQTSFFNVNYDRKSKSVNLRNVNKIMEANKDANQKRYGKKSDKETQSPVIKVFQDMMQREKNDSEKSNLLKEKQDRKRRPYSGSRMKTEHHKQKGHESSSSERQKQLNAIQYESEYPSYRCQSRIPFQEEKSRKSWFFGGDAEKKRSEDTCSCVSCALKKIISSEYTCIACLGVLFVLSVAAAFMLVFKTVPVPITNDDDKKPSCEQPEHHVHDHHEHGKKTKHSGYDDPARLSDGFDDRQTWSDIASRHLSGLTGMTGYTDDLNRDWSSEEVGLKSDSELSSVLDTAKINEGLGNEKLRSFYKKLIKTDAEIRNLKKGINDISGTQNSKFDYISERKKRSLRFGHPKSSRSDTKLSSSNQPVSPYDNSKFNLYFPPFIALSTTRKSNKAKRYVNDTDEPTGYVIEKKQIIVQYKPSDNMRKVPKCSHVPKDSLLYKSHEKQLKHPFYKNTQRLDELLDRLLDKNLPELMADPFGVGTLFKNEKDTFRENSFNKIPPEISFNKVPPEISFNKVSPEKSFNKVSPEESGIEKILMAKMKDNKAEADAGLLDILMTTVRDRHQYDYTTPSSTKRKLKGTTTPNFNVLLSVSTIVNPAHKFGDNKQSMLFTMPPSVPYLRKLMQVHEEDDENIGYEDINEVLADEPETHDDREEGQERKKRMEDYPMDLPILPSHPGVDLHNPNWKGPMPLYPDELVSMVKQAAIKNLELHRLNKMKLPDNKDKADLDYLESSLNDVQYIESYSDKANDGLMKMAQAYSDYGVFDEKKASLKTEKSGVTEKFDNRKKPLKKRKSRKHNMFDRIKKSTAEGFNLGYMNLRTLEESSLHKDKEKEEDESQSLLSTILRKHIRFGLPEPEITRTSIDEADDSSTFISVHRDPGVDSKKSQEKYTNDDEIFTVRYSKGKSRHLLSIDETSNHKINNSSELTAETNTSNSSGQDFMKAVLDINNINMKNNSQTTDLSDFFMMASSWFSALAASAFNLNNSKSLENNSRVMKIDTQKHLSETRLGNNKSLEAIFSNYDAEMFENIGHRSRMLMSVEDLKTNTIHTTIKPRYEDGISSNRQDNGDMLSVTTIAPTTLLVEQTIGNITDTDLDVTTTNVLETDNNTVVKRNANEGSNLIFWNDMYDDEYGVKLDPIDSNLSEKQYSARGMNLVKKSRNWIHNKVKNIASNIREVRTSKRKVSTTTEPFCNRVVRSPKYYGTSSYSKYNKYKQNRKRNVNIEGDEKVSENENIFEVLTKKMKEVCKEAAQAVQHTRNVKVVRQSQKDDVLSTSLMQQLVRLMTDVIEYQVREKTCLRLPPDLQDFLEWITSANTENVQTRSSKVEIHDEDIDPPVDPSPSSEREEDVHTDTRSDCLGTIHAVEDLMQQYDEMSEDDKMKMTGIREYLENQLQFLHNHLASFDESKLPTYYQDTDIPYRLKRYAQITQRNNMQNNKRKIYQEKKRRCRRKFMKNFNKKHTRSTASIYDAGVQAELYKPTNKSVANNKYNDDKLKRDDVNRGVNAEKRNLKDVYYKAIAEAKKYTTFKRMHKNVEIDGFDNAKVVRIEK